MDNQLIFYEILLDRLGTLTFPSTEFLMGEQRMVRISLTAVLETLSHTCSHEINLMVC